MRSATFIGSVPPADAAAMAISRSSVWSARSAALSSPESTDVEDSGWLNLLPSR